MFCESWRTKLSEAAVSGEALPREAEAHLAECTACRAAFEEERQLFTRIDGGLRSMANTEVPASLASRVRIAVAAPPLVRTWRTPVWGLVAASLLLVAGVTYKPERIPRPVVPAQAASTANSTTAPPSPDSSDSAPEVSPLAPTPLRSRVQAVSGRESTAQAKTEILVSGDEEANLRRYMNRLRAGNVNHTTLLVVPGDAEIKPLEIAQLELPQLFIEPLESGDSR